MKPDVGSYLNVFLFLQDYYAYRKSREPDFSYAVWAKELGIKNKSHVRFIVLGKRPLGQSMVAKLCETLGFDVREKEIFSMLANYSQSRTEEQRRVLGQELIRLLKGPSEQTEVKAEYEALRNPLTIAVRTLLTFKDISADTKQLATLFCVSEAAIQESLEALKKLEGVNSRHARVPDKAKDLGLEEFYKGSFKSADQALNENPKARRFRSWFVAFSEEEFQKFVVEAEAGVREKVLAHDDDNFENRRLYQVLMTTFPMTTPQ